MNKNKVLILDDEPMFLDWIEDYIYSLGFEVKFVTSVNEAYVEIQDDKNKYAALILDLNVPVSAELEDMIQQKEEIFHEYRGLYIAQQARNLGYPGKSIIIYSVHHKASVDEMCSRIEVSYIPKGRAKILKDRISTILTK